MSRRAGSALLGPLLALACGAVAQDAPTVPVRTGDHDGFTRVVLQFAAPRSWRLGRSAEGYVLAIDAPAGFDLSTVWQRIGRDRLADIAAGADGRSLRLGLGCDCHATAFVHDGSWLVIDIRDGAAPPEARFETALDAAPDAGNANAASAAPPPVAAISDALPPVLARRTPNLPDTASTDPAALSDPGALDRATRVADAQAAILEQISRAAGQGLLEGRGLADGPAPRDPDRPRATEGGAPGTAPGSDILAERAGIAAETAVDHDQAPRRAAPPSRCPDRAEHDVAAWGDDRPPGVQIGALRRALAGEFDRVDPDAALRLARLYIHLGFGQEARSAIDRFAPDHPSAGTIRALAAIVDRGAAPVGDPLRQWIDCPGPVALWAVLARQHLSPGAPIRRADLSQAFIALPAHLRTHLGPGLAERLLVQGDAELAGVIRRATARTPGGDGGPTLAGARVDLATGAEAVGAAALEAVARGSGPDAATALAALLERRADAGQTIAEDLIGLAEARAFELRSRPLGTRLKAAELRARAVNGDPAGAFDALARAQRDGTAPADAPVWLTRALAMRATDADLATAYFRHRAVIDGADLPAETARALARRLQGAGLAGPALALLDIQDRRSEPEDWLVRAELHLARDDPAAALIALDRVEGARTAALRAQALDRAGAPAAALAALPAEAPEGLRADLAWRAGDWALVGSIGRAPQIAALDAARPAAAAATDAPPTLAGTAALLEANAAARADLRALLDAHPAEPAEPAEPADPGRGTPGLEGD